MTQHRVLGFHYFVTIGQGRLADSRIHEIADHALDAMGSSIGHTLEGKAASIDSRVDYVYRQFERRRHLTAEQIQEKNNREG